MATHPLAGKPAPANILENISRLVSDYYTLHPDISFADQRVAFGTSGHRGSSKKSSFNEDHLLAICQAVCEYRQQRAIDGPLFLGMDTHALSEPAMSTALEVFAANEVQVRYQQDRGWTPTPVISHAILGYNRDRQNHLADGVIITPSHNPPSDGGIKYNPPHGGPASGEVTDVIEARANAILQDGLKDVKRLSLSTAMNSSLIQAIDFIDPYVADLENVVDMKAIRDAKLHIGVDPLGGSGIRFWEPIAEQYQLNIELVNNKVDPTFSFMCVDKDGKIRMDCSSPYAMAGLIGLKDKYDIAFGNDPDYDRHGIVTPSSGLLNPNHYLAVAIQYLFSHRPEWPTTAKVGKTLVSSSMIDRVVLGLGRELCEVPVGFKWFVDGLVDGSFGFGGEESAGASFLRRNGQVWTTDKDGIILALLSAEITAVTGKDPGEHYKKMEEQFGSPIYSRSDAPASREEKAILSKLSPDQVSANTLAGDPITAKLTAAPGNGAAIGGLKVCTEHAWFAARPSGTEDIYKIYAESFKGEDHLRRVQEEAQGIVSQALK